MGPDVEKDEEVGVAQRADRARLLLEAAQAVGVRGERRQDLEGDLATEPRVARAVDLAHAARAEGAEDFVGAEPGARGQGHGSLLARDHIEVEPVAIP